MLYDALIIGGGAIGVAVARELSLLGKKCIICEKNENVLDEASSGNTGHLATNFYYTKERAPLEFAMTRIASKVLNPEWLRTQPNVPRKRCGSIYIAKSNEDLVELNAMYNIGKANGEDIRKIEVTEIQRMEPNLNTDGIKQGLYSPNEYVIDPFLLPLSNLYTALELGCDLITKCKVVDAQWLDDNEKAYWKVFTESKTTELEEIAKRHFLAKVVINCAGNYSDETDRLFESGKNTFDITPAKGEFIVLTSSPSIVNPLTNGMVNCIPSKTFAGPYMFSSVYNHFVVGPTKITQESKTDRTCNEKSIEFLKSYAIKHFPCLRVQTGYLFETYSGLRPQDLKNVDYDIKFDPKSRWATVGAIRSTGLTASRAIAQYVIKTIYAEYSHLPKLKEIEMPSPIIMKNGTWKIGNYVFKPTHKLSQLRMKQGSDINTETRSSL